MKLKIGNKIVGQEQTYDVDADVESLIDKGLDQHERLENKRIDIISENLKENRKTWKERFNTKHNAKKEMLEIKNKHELDKKELELKKKSPIKEFFDGINNNKMLKLEEQRKEEEERLRREEEEKLRLQKEKKALGTILLIGGLIATVFGYGFGSGSGNLGLEAIGGLGFIIAISGLIVLIRYNRVTTDNKKKK